MIDSYTRVLEEVAETADAQAAEEAAKKLVAHLASAGRMKMLPQILRELRKVAARRAALSPVVEAASEQEARQALAEAKAAGIAAKEARITPALIRGWRARAGGVLVDRSAKRALVSLYQKVTT